MEIGYFYIKIYGYVMPARYDGTKWHHERGRSLHEEVEVVCNEHGTPIPVPFSCPTGCTCITNSDGSVTTHCQ